jgi:hypothetical protein
MCEHCDLAALVSLLPHRLRAFAFEERVPHRLRALLFEKWHRRIIPYHRDPDKASQQSTLAAECGVHSFYGYFGLLRNLLYGRACVAAFDEQATRHLDYSQMGFARLGPAARGIIFTFCPDLIGHTY